MLMSWRVQLVIRHKKLHRRVSFRRFLPFIELVLQPEFGNNEGLNFYKVPLPTHTISHNNFFL